MRCASRAPPGSIHPETSPVPAGAHVVQKNLSTLVRLGVESGPVRFPFVVPDSAVARQVVVDAAAQGPGPFVLINPGAGWPNKRWPPERFGAVAAAIREEHTLPTFVLWGRDEAALADAVIASSRGAAVRAPETSLGDLLALTSRAALMISGDTGPTHIAAAMKTPIVGLYGPTWPERNGPWDPDDVVVSRATQCVCHHKRQCQRDGPVEGAAHMCLNDISVDELCTRRQASSVAREWTIRVSAPLHSSALRAGESHSVLPRGRSSCGSLVPRGRRCCSVPRLRRSGSRFESGPPVHLERAAKSRDLLLIVSRGTRSISDIAHGSRCRDCRWWRCRRTHRPGVHWETFRPRFVLRRRTCVTSSAARTIRMCSADHADDSPFQPTRAIGTASTIPSPGSSRRWRCLRSSSSFRYHSWFGVREAGAVSSVGRAPALHAGCHRFESCTAHSIHKEQGTGRRA